MSAEILKRLEEETIESYQYRLRNMEGVYKP
jgi:hypothetical protein